VCLPRCLTALLPRRQCAPVMLPHCFDLFDTASLPRGYSWPSLASTAAIAGTQSIASHELSYYLSIANPCQSPLPGSSPGLPAAVQLAVAPTCRCTIKHTGHSSRCCDASALHCAALDCCQVTPSSSADL
jgi:hypothetical protein